MNRGASEQPEHCRALKASNISWIRTLHALNGLAPVVAMVTLLVLAVWPNLIGENVDRAATDARVREVGAKLALMPFRLGDWVGTDEDLPAAALEILHASSVVSRQYTNLRTGERARLAIVYCGDARDMLGHHPPICYPRSGWNMALDTSQISNRSDAAAAQSSLVVQGDTIATNLYRFQKVDSSGLDRRITIVGFFAVPGVGLTRDERVLREQSGSRTQSALGVGQVQVLLDGHPNRVDVERIAKSLLESLPAGTFDMLLGIPADDGATGRISERTDGRTERFGGMR